ERRRHAFRGVLRLLTFRLLDAGLELLGLARKRLELLDFVRTRARVGNAFGQRLLGARDFAVDLVEPPVQLVQLAAAVVARQEIRRRALRAAGAVTVAGPALGEAALVGAEGFQALVAPGDIALAVRHHVVLRA